MDDNKTGSIFLKDLEVENINTTNNTIYKADRVELEELDKDVRERFEFLNKNNRELKSNINVLKYRLDKHIEYCEEYNEAFKNKLDIVDDLKVCVDSQLVINESFMTEFDDLDAKSKDLDNKIKNLRIFFLLLVFINIINSALYITLLHNKIKEIENKYNIETNIEGEINNE